MLDALAGSVDPTLRLLPRVSDPLLSQPLSTAFTQLYN